MGLAASQARFLSLTARKSNVEYEGQQVNQQRTALANESANLYNKLTSIQVPTPPSTSDYYETVYTFTASDLDISSSTGSTQYTLNNIYTMPDGTYANLTYTAYKWESAATSAYSGNINTKYDTTTGKTSTSVSLANGVTADAVEYTYRPAENAVALDFSQADSVRIAGIDFSLDDTGSQILGGYDASTGKYAYAYDVEDLGNGKYSLKLTITEDQDNPDTYKCSIGGQSYDAVLQSDGTYKCIVTSEAEGGEEYSSSVSGKYVNADGNANSAVTYLGDGFTSYTPEGSNSISYNQPVLAYTLNNQTYFISAAEYAKGEFASSSYVQSVGYPQSVSYPCVFSTAASGRYQTLTVTDDNGITHTYSLNVESVEDEEAYAQAMLDYEYQQAQYNKEIADINAKTEALQQEDRTLELRLKQLDTEQNAIATEMDAVSKVIEDNIEATFNTFG